MTDLGNTISNLCGLKWCSLDLKYVDVGLSDVCSSSEVLEQRGAN